MKTVGIRDLKDNPSRAVRAAREHAVLITSRDDPEALLLSLRNPGEHEADARITIAATLYDEAGMSLGRAARLAGTDVAAFIEYCQPRHPDLPRRARRARARPSGPRWVSPELVLDTTALIAPARLDLLEAVGDRPGRLVVPAAVFEEAWPAIDRARHRSGEPSTRGSVRVAAPAETASAGELRLGPGEAAAIALATTLDAIIVLDDRDARRVAGRRGVPLHRDGGNPRPAEAARRDPVGTRTLGRPRWIRLSCRSRGARVGVRDIRRGVRTGPVRDRGPRSRVR
ncbi:MAG: UPF0175 family protein [Acidimicrobiia bacterium]|nr:UPF0175 family protein [Acidimicrobiia bacterium]